MKATLVVFLALLASTSLAAETSVRPVVRPGTAEASATEAPSAALAVVAEASSQTIKRLRPKARPKSVIDSVERVLPEPTQEQVAEKASKFSLIQSLRPLVRPKDVVKQGERRQAALAKGAICGDPAIQGEAVGAVPSKTNGCGIDSAVRVRSVSGVKLSQASLMDCGTAKALKTWVDKGMKPAVNGKGGGVAKINIMGHYTCRPRNNQKGAKISEHGKGRAIDIGGFTLADGTEFTVLKHWRSKTFGKVLQQMHSKACGPFGTVLGPKANQYHQDHFHFDTARYRSGSYCK
ncbi:extensin family protein [Donghicola tyrosinivorans]|uniref:Extensin-like protein n=1 Tax=Donghicola tyrosinivorans TaxID=1652492 RepID=A0A2T0X0H9_9RHOB|nr:extensin family protein [Donghicola tyrosinivorans]PRY92405.1 extensin-like protein [Donghicola tyrosinivorans]